jgi:hypothetical protein
VGIARNNEGFYELNDFLSQHTAGGKLFPNMPPCLPNVWFVFPYGSRKLEQLSENEFLGVRQSDLNRIRYQHTRAAYRKMIAWRTVTFAGTDDYSLHRHLRAIDNNILLSRLTGSMVAASDETFIPEPQLLEQFADFPELLQNARRIIDESIH